MLRDPLGGDPFADVKGSAGNNPFADADGSAEDDAGKDKGPPDELETNLTNPRNSPR